MKSCIWLSVAVLLGVAIGSQARAATSVAVLGVRSLDGEDGLERRLSAALRKSAAAHGDYALSDRELSLEQMSLAQGCEEPDARCLAEIAKTLGVAQLLYGTVVGTAQGYELTLYTFDAGPGRLTSVVEHQLGAAQLKAHTAEATVTALLRRLAEVPPPRPEPQPEPEPEFGQLRIVGDAPGAEIMVDREPRGVLDEDGELVVELSPGKHAVRAARGKFGPTEERLALVEAGRTAVLKLELPRPPQPAAPQDEPVAAPLDAPREDDARSSRSQRRAWGWVSVGLGSAFAAATIYSWVRINQINKSDDYTTYRAQFPASGPMAVSNACAEAADGTLAQRDRADAPLERRARELCEEADTLQLLQYVFLGGALVGGGVGTYLLVSARRDSHATVQLAPRFGTGTAVLEASMRF